MPSGPKIDASRTGAFRSPAEASRPTQRALGALLIAALWLCAIWDKASAAPSLVIEYPSGAVLYEDHATQPWYPASLTKLMTTYVALKAIRDHRLSLDTPLVVSARAVSMPPSKMGFRPGTMVTLGNALKMIMVKSANDTAVTIAEGVSGSVEAFADEMNEAAASLGMSQSHFVNPNGLPNPEHYSSARDFGILALALYTAFPEHADLFSIGALRLGGEIITNHNNLLGRYPGVDGMKTGFTCAAGFNVVASATLGGRKLIAVVLGAPNVPLRTIKAAALFDRGFAGIDRPGVNVASLPVQPGASTPDGSQPACRKRGKAVAEFNAETERLIAPLEARQGSGPSDRPLVYDASALAKPTPMARRIALAPTPSFDPSPVFVGAAAGYSGPIAQARPPHSPVGTEPPAEAAPSNPPTLAERAAPAPAPVADPGESRARRRLAHSREPHARGRRHYAAREESGQIGSKDVEPSLKKTKAAKPIAAEKRKVKAAEKPTAAEKKSEPKKPAEKTKLAAKSGESGKGKTKPAADKHQAGKPTPKLAQKPNPEKKAAGHGGKPKPAHAASASQ